MDWARLILSGIFCTSFILIAFYSVYAEFLHYRNKDSENSQYFTTPAKFRRRLFTSILLIIVMIMIFAGVNFISFSSPESFLLYWGICTFLSIFLFILPILDMRENALMYIERKKSIQKEMKEMKKILIIKETERN